MKILRIMSVATAVSAGLVTVGLTQALANPSVSYTIKNNSSGSILSGYESCAATGMPFPAQIAPNETIFVSNTGIYDKVYVCGVKYQAASGNLVCYFNVARTFQPSWVGGYWKAPTVYLISGDTKNCSGKVSSSSIDGDFSVTLDYNF